MAKKTTGKKPRKTRERVAKKTTTSSASTPLHHSDEIERALLTGESRGLLEDQFGPENYSQLQDLARAASARSVRGGPRVLILPGIMGSMLAKKVFLGIEDYLWINPVEVAAGKLTNLALDGADSPYHASGVILPAYLKLKLRLKIAGYDADYFAYDWRKSLNELGPLLAAAVRDEPASAVNLVAHSMGGLLARAALSSLGADNKKIARIIMLGTPNYGSFAPVQAMRATYDVVQKIAKLDLKHKPEDLATEVFSSFPGLYELLPAPEKFNALNLYDQKAWPQVGPQPRPKLLSAVKAVINKLAPADSRFFLIAGVNQDTVTSVRVNGDEFALDISPDGDGTVPLAFAQLAGIPANQTYYVEESHGSLPNNGAVESAVNDLLAKGTTSVLPQQRPASHRAMRTVSEEALKAAARRARGEGALGSSDYRRILDAVAASPKPEREVISIPVSVPGTTGTDSGASPQFRNLTIGRRRQRRIEIMLAHGSLTDVDSRAYVLGVFRNVAPSGAASAVDLRMDGAITEFTARRMLSGEMGAIFMVPVGQSQLAADMVLFVGLGSFDRFTSEMQQMAAENVIRVLSRGRIDEFATILMGSGSGQNTASTVQNLLIGFFRGLKDADPRHRFRSITLCEMDSARYAEMKSEIYRLAGTPLFDDVELTLDEIEVPPVATPSARALIPGQEPVYAMIRQEGQTKSQLHYRVSILGSGMKAAVVNAVKDVPAKELDQLLDKFDQALKSGSGAKDIPVYGEQFAALALPSEIRTVLQSMQDRHLVVVHDSETARVPWETITLNGWSPALAAGMSRRYLADNLPVATWLEERRAAATLKLLLVVNPLGDLDGAEKEGDRILQLAGSSIDVVQLRQKDASRAAILSALRGGQFDCIHYAGHAFFDPQGPGRSGLFCAGKEILSGADVMGISNLPSLVFFNACEAGRIRGAAAPATKPASVRMVESASVAEALMRGGVTNYMSTYWPVGDDSAKIFSETFYKSILAGNTIGAAVLEGRKAVLNLKDRDWADYILYGSFDFVLKSRKVSTEK